MEETEEFIARPYQIDLYEKALQSNTIIYLPTGAGKTYISIMLLKRLSSDLYKNYSNNGKRTIFLVNTVHLVYQQSQYIQRHTGLQCKGYSGDMNVDSWPQETWLQEFEQFQVLVMTSQILLNILCSGFIKLKKINLLIFDECHRAVHDHPMRLIMQQFQECPKNEQPKILALSATLLNANVKLNNIDKSIKSLEVTFLAKIATVANIKEYCANPQEIITYYESYIPTKNSNIAIEILTNLNKLIKELVIPDLLVNNESSEVFKPKSLLKKLSNIIENVKYHINLTGLYGVNKCVLLYLIKLECLKKSIINQDTMFVLEHIITEFIQLRKLFFDEMKDYTDKEKIIKFSSNRVLQLFTFLKDFNENKRPDQNFCCIIFVNRRLTAKILYHILKDIHTFDETFKFLCPDYIIGCSNGCKTFGETDFIAKWNNEALLRFRNGLTNCAIATDVLDEGIDIPICTLIVRFDLPLDFRSYVQSKGRARYKTSQYVLMINKTDHDYINKYKLFKEMDFLVQQMVSETIRELPNEEDIKDDLYKYNIDPYIISKSDGTTSILTEYLAVSLINKYCSLLFKSKFINLSPTWKLYTSQNGENKQYQVHLTLPMVSLLRETVIGDVMYNINAAKRSAALKACIELHKLGELTDNFLINKNVILKNTNNLFPHWVDEDKATNPGSKQNKRHHTLEYPKALYHAFPLEGKTLYLHILNAQPVYSIPQDNRNLEFYYLLQNKAGFGILSTKTMPQVPLFPIFMNVGEMSVNVEVNYEKMVLNTTEIMKLRIFHTTIFKKIIPIIKQFMTFDTANLENCFLIVPTDHQNKIDWSVVNKNGNINYTEITKSSLSNTDYKLALVVPNYRASPNVYVVTQVCDDITPNSCFPTGDFISYAHYYQQKHQLKVQNLDQPMFEVKAISMNINCIKPRGKAHSSSKRADTLEDHDEHLVPELCQKVEFLALYWLKATMLPSILHRMSQLLIALDLRETIVEKADLGTSINKLIDHTWPPLLINTIALKKRDIPMGVTLDDIETTQSVIDLSESMFDDAILYPWSKEQEPPDLDRNAEQIQLIDVEYYCHVMNHDYGDNHMLVKKNENKMIKYKNRPTILAPNLSILDTKGNIGPDPVQIMQALTTKGNDIFDYERLEILGDSYLKFIVSLYLYSAFPTYNEGHLTTLKGKIIGNRNLYYCGTSKSIPGRMKVDDFIPMSTFIPPAYTTFRPIQSILLNNEVSPNILFEFFIPEKEMLSGEVSLTTVNDMEQKIVAWGTEETQTGMEHFIGVQTISDKVVADCVEALIGVYLMSMGIEGAAKLLIWFDILPKEINIIDLLYNNTQKPEIDSRDLSIHMPWAQKIEETVGYQFTNRTLLLQAFTHPSYTANGITDCYQRLEFLGDALIDFLITGYIYEYCGELDPGEVTDLRSALVNNITFSCLTVKYGLHTALLFYAPQLNDIIDRFVKFQEGRNYAVDDELIWTLLEEDECYISESVDVPKILADLFESLIGAIYLDSNKNIKKVWEILFGFMYKEIDAFSKNVPKKPVRAIYETPGITVKFLPAKVIEDTNTIMVSLEITSKKQSKKVFHGCGVNKKQAKCAAAKQALKYLRCKNE